MSAPASLSFLSHSPSGIPTAYSALHALRTRHIENRGWGHFLFLFRHRHHPFAPHGHARRQIRRPIILTLFVAILGAGSCLMSLSSSVAQAPIFFAIIGIGHSACWAPIVAVVMRWVGPRRRGITEAGDTLCLRSGLLLVIAISGSAGKLILAYVSDRMGRIEIMMLCGLLAALGPLGMAYSRELSTLSIFSAIFGVGYGTIWAVYAASARDFFPGEYSGSIVGLWTLFHGVGSAIAPVLSGWTIDATGAYYRAFILAAAGSLLSLLLLLPLQGVREGR